MYRSTQENKSLRILLVEDSDADAYQIRQLLVEARFSQASIVRHATTVSEALAAIRSDVFDAILLDMHLPDSWGVDTVTLVCAEAPDTPVLVLTSLRDEALGRRSIREGAQDFLVKGEFDGRLLVRAIRYAIQRRVLWRRLERSLDAAKRRESRLFALVSSSTDGMLVVAEDGTVRFANVAAEIMLDRRAGDLVGASFGLPLEGPGRTEVDILRPDALGQGEAESTVVEMTVIEMTWQDEEALLVTLHPVAAPAISEAPDLVDPLTGLHTRVAFEILARHKMLVAQRNKVPLTLYLWDVNGLEATNRSYGRGAGDQALSDFAVVLQRTLRTSDVVARVGGDEFAVLACNLADTSALENRLRDRWQEQERSSSRPFALSFACGRATLPAGTHSSLEGLLQRAAQSMLQGKKEIRTANRESRSV